MLPREPQPSGDTLGAALAQDEVELGDGRKLRRHKLLVATGRRPRTQDTGLETVGMDSFEQGIPVDSHLRVAERVWAVGDVTGI